MLLLHKYFKEFSLVWLSSFYFWESSSWINIYWSLLNSLPIIGSFLKYFISTLTSLILFIIYKIFISSSIRLLDSLKTFWIFSWFGQIFLQQNSLPRETEKNKQMLSQNLNWIIFAFITFSSFLCYPQKNVRRNEYFFY